MVSHLILAVRAHIKAGQIGAASEAIERIRQIGGSTTALAAWSAPRATCTT
jgi:hypothetical protein